MFLTVRDQVSHPYITALTYKAKMYAQ
jgi:hypothetical protein